MCNANTGLFAGLVNGARSIKINHQRLSRKLCLRWAAMRSPQSGACRAGVRDAHCVFHLAYLGECYRPVCGWERCLPLPKAAASRPGGLAFPLPVVSITGQQPCLKAATKGRYPPVIRGHPACVRRESRGLMAGAVQVSHTKAQRHEEERRGEERRGSPDFVSAPSCLRAFL